MFDKSLKIPEAWQKIQLSDMEGVLIVAGGTDVGKSTLARYLYARLSAERNQPAAYLDGDPGQSSLGPPAVLSAALGESGLAEFPPDRAVFRYFIGSVTPRGRLLAMLVGAARLVQAVQQLGARSVVLDSSGLVSASGGGLALIAAEIELLRPAAVFAIQKGRELEEHLQPLRRSRRAQIITLAPAPAARKRSTPARKRYRQEQFARYFENGRSLRVDWARLAVFPKPDFRLHQLLALEDREGFARDLGIVLDIDLARRRVTLHTPLVSLEGITVLHLGEMTVDPRSYQDAAFPLHPGR